MSASESVAGERLPEAPGGPSRVAIVDIDMPFGSMVRLLVKWAFAAIPAMILVFLTYTLVWFFVRGVLVGFG